MLKKFIISSFLFLLITTILFAGKREAFLWDCIEWSVENKTFSENPFDLVATVRFVHTSAKHEHECEMFYSGDSIWKFRFTGTALGEWTYKTESNDPELDGIKGSVIVKANKNQNAKGFLTHMGNQYAIWSGNKPELTAYWFNIYMDGTKFPSFDGKLKNKPYYASPFYNFQFTDHIRDYIHNTQRNGFEIMFIHPGHPHVWTNGTKIDNGINPRLKTFNILDSLIILAHQEGMRIHIWLWGDQARKATPIPLKGGINGIVDKRLQRYIAARLGPLPGWSMGYGFDLHEWTNSDEVNEWASYLHEHMGWKHLLSARGHKLVGNYNINSYDGVGRDVPLASSKHGPQNFLEVYNTMQSDTSKPHLYEERHSYLRSGYHLDMKGTRRLIWWNIMAGGMGDWFGFYPNSTQYFKAYPYPNPEQFITAHRFWDKHFELGMTSIYKDNTPILLSKDGKKIIIYQEETDIVNLDFSELQGKILQAFAIDTRKKYKEIKIKDPIKTEKIWKSPYISDWILIIKLK